MSRSLIQQQFGANAGRYVTSKVHAQGQSLARMVALAEPQPDWITLDVAPGGGHSALAIAPFVRRAWALDITAQMLDAARRFAQPVAIAWVQGDGAVLPWPAETFDLVTCRVALHHFPDQPAAIRDWARVLKSGGRLVLVDNVGPDDDTACGYVNIFETIRDPSHARVYPLPELVHFMEGAGLMVRQTERLAKPMNFHAWMDRMQVAAPDRERLHTMLWHSTGQARTFLDPQGEGEETTFSLREGVILAEKP